jgi:hypothetical protein
MNILINVLVKCSIALWFFLIWCYTMLISSDIPVAISYDEMRNIVLTLIGSTILTLVYTKIASDNNLFFFIGIPAFLWGASMTQSLIYSYHKYYTLLSVVGFIGCLFIILFSFFNARRLKKTS